MEHIGYDWGVRKSTVFESIKWVEETLVKDGAFKLPGKKVLKENNTGIEYIVVDVTESPIERPQKNRRNTIPGRKNDTP
jgi:hypothetical protein